jgi:hypothetical protein
LALDVQACVEVGSNDETTSVINALSAIFKIFTWIKAKKRLLIQSTNLSERIPMKHKFLLPLALIFLLLPVTSQAEGKDFEEEVAFLELIQGYYNLVESTQNRCTLIRRVQRFCISLPSRRSTRSEGKRSELLRFWKRP